MGGVMCERETAGEITGERHERRALCKEICAQRRIGHNVFGFQEHRRELRLEAPVEREPVIACDRDVEPFLIDHFGWIPLFSGSPSPLSLNVRS